MACPYCESENWSRDGFHMAEEWVSDNYVIHYIQCVCGNCERNFFERVEEPIGIIRFRFTFIIDQSDRDSIKRYMDNVIRGAEAILEDTDIRY